MWVDVLLSIVTGLVLWILLRRGVVLTRATKHTDWQGRPRFDTWEIKNDSALPVRLTSVWVKSPGYEGELSWEGGGGDGISLSFDDEVLKIAREDRERPWREVIVPPGDTLTAVVGGNRSLFIVYRRAGWTGLLERRMIVVHGGV
jgi:hypothetical protein